ncbi:hypothetical protein CCM_01599 [Cordyceps militaris CM01]|uniref:Uncharacterized protein n=1 Tax=Cordyceps militaris (strain CM01) TaxID=983644 RepID=G3J5Y8_CORMM|nr:uncharacterized protein CCM_01599 [Cordyceps militaris CM01]EGX96940.1 hypothetical protein CCM_01599 [Cordyceps militaris CM01]
MRPHFHLPSQNEKASVAAEAPTLFLPPSPLSARSLAARFLGHHPRFAQPVMASSVANMATSSYHASTSVILLPSPTPPGTRMVFAYMNFSPGSFKWLNLADAAAWVSRGVPQA